jgi:hypothetical protein
MITDLYRVEVLIPQAVWDRFNESMDYQKAVITATCLSDEAGSSCYGPPYEWATFTTLEAARICEWDLQKVVEYFTSKVTG